MIQDYFNRLSNEDQEHSERVKEIALKIADQITKTYEEIKIDKEKLSTASLYLDIGKIMVNQNFLNKRGPLTTPERTEIMLHAKYSSNLILKSGLSKDIAKIAMLHHENYDGSGYPFKLNGEEIPIESRIIRVSDVFDALCSKRSYKEAFDITEALGIIEIERVRYDQLVIKALKSVISINTPIDTTRTLCYNKV